MADKLPTRQELLNQNKTKEPTPNGENPDLEKAKVEAQIAEQVRQKTETEIATNLLEKGYENIEAALNDINEKRMELEHRSTDLDAREKVISERERKSENLAAELGIREAEVSQRESDVDATLAEIKAEHEQLGKVRQSLQSWQDRLTVAQREKQAEEAEKQTVKYQLTNHLQDICELLTENAVLLKKAGMGKIARVVAGDAEELLSFDLGEKQQDALDLLIEDVDVCNKRAVMMARAKPGTYQEKWWNGIVDNLEKIYGYCPTLKPSYLPKESDSMVVEERKQ